MNHVNINPYTLHGPRQEGPQISWRGLTSFQRCTEGSHPYSCAIFADRRPSTIAMTVLVVVEMFNALNALSENSSLLVQPPWRNLWLLAAIAVSMVRETDGLVDRLCAV